MKYKLLIILLLPVFCFAQEKDTLAKKLDSLARLPDSVDISAESYNEVTKLTFRSYVYLLGNNFKQQATGPFHTKGDDWVKVAGFGGVVSLAMLSEKKIQVYARELRERNEEVEKVGQFMTNFGATYEMYTLAALAAYGFVFKNEKIKTTTYLASQAFITSYAWFNVGKFLAGRQRPNYIAPGDHDPRPVFHGPFQRFKNPKPADNSVTSFPSGHASLVFAAATVYAMEYRDRPLVPILSYTAASLVALTRITENKHWASDILVGAGIGFLTGRQVVNNYHRYARIKRAEAAKKGQKVSFNLQYVNGTLIPGMVYRFD